ncbi:phosphatidylinositol-binding protein scs2 [Allomyces javanicus]|nr:phosphatidylinositol-binding protein scs2 [Allomyces javanicus]
MSVKIDPASQLSFQRPFTNGCTATLTITNRDDATVAFKVKTTAPMQYCVRPKWGTIGRFESITLEIDLVPTAADLPLGYKCKDKFLVQSIKLLQAELDLPLDYLTTPTPNTMTQPTAAVRASLVALLVILAAATIHVAHAADAAATCPPPVLVDDFPYSSLKGDQSHVTTGIMSMLTDPMTFKQPTTTCLFRKARMG